MDRIWFLTNSTYGTWLPGDRRGFVGHVADHRVEDSEDDHRIMHNLLGTPYDEDIPGLYTSAQNLMLGPPIELTLEHATIAKLQFLETAKFRNWTILAGSIMWNHFHLVVGVWGDPDPGKILGDFKSWGTRALSKHFGEPAPKTWWTERGSKRKLPNESACRTVIEYFLHKQPNPLVVWSTELASGAA